jgi:predicted dehydrogenase
MTIRVGLIGYGYAGRTFHAPLLSAEPGMALTMVASREAAKVHADLPGVTVLADPLAVATSDAIDLVVIASPNASHAPLADAALRAGRHVVVDKPFTLDTAEARGLVALAARQDRLLSVFHNRRWDSDWLSVARAIRDGAVGRPVHLQSQIDRFRPAVRDRWREGGGPGSGVWFDLGPHLVDQALLLFGLPDRVHASFAQARDGALADDWAHVVLEQGERRSVLQASMLVAGGSPRLVVHGDGGSIVKQRADRQEAQLLAGMRPDADGWGVDDDALRLFDANGAETARPAGQGDQRRYYAGIAVALRGEGPNPVPPVQALAVMAVVEAAAIAAATGRATVPDLTAAEREALIASYRA